MGEENAFCGAGCAGGVDDGGDVLGASHVGEGVSV